MYQTHLCQHQEEVQRWCNVEELGAFNSQGNLPTITAKIHRLAKKGELSYEDEKFSYIVFSKDDTNIKGERILRHPQIGKGFIKIKTCSQKGIEEKVITKKQGEIYKKLKKQNAGDLINND